MKYPKTSDNPEIENLKQNAKQERTKRELERWGTHAKNWGGEALILSSALPTGGAILTTGTIAKILAPKVGTKAAGVLAKMIADGAVSGAAYGAGENLQNDKSPVTGAAKGAIAGVATGAGLYGIGRKIAQAKISERQIKIFPKM